ncbi:MAG: class I SAM-dependent methyltransferase [Candidatus Rokuibacteriota bacterium]
MSPSGRAGDPWLERWLPLLGGSPAGPVLELGCGRGRDTATLVAAGRAVVAADRNLDALRECRARVPAARRVQLDLGAPPLPFASARFPVVVASLSLHYFAWDVTLVLAGEIARCLAPSGALILRLNSTEDVHHGAAAPDEIEPGLKLFEGAPKRFFDRAAVEALLRGWRIDFLEHSTIDRYENPKTVWEAVARPPAP